MKKENKLAVSLLEWYAENKRDLPWRQAPSPYHVWISEIMLQQTRVEAVKGYYRRFLKCLPDIKSLSEADEDELLKLWQGLGYYNRVRNLKRAAVILTKEYDSVFPEEFEEIMKLPGIGAYTAGAIASIAFGKCVPAVDGNVYRIYTRLYGDGEDIGKVSHQKRIREEIIKLIPEKCPGDFNQALMDLGAMVCLPNGEPLCAECPLLFMCKAGKEGNPTDYPYKMPKKQRRVEEKTVLLLEYEGRYMIRKRPDNGLLAGLWEFPCLDGRMSPEEVSALLENFCGQVEELELLGKGKHIFSHIEWRMFGYMVHLKKTVQSLPEELILVSVEELKTRYSIPAAFAHYLNRIPGIL